MLAGDVVVGLTGLLVRWRQGDDSVERELVAQFYPTLRKLARAQVRRYSGALTLCPTELANEVYEKLYEQRSVAWRGGEHFLAIAATLLRRIAIDYLRYRSAEKRGGASVAIAIDEIRGADEPSVSDATDWLALDQALTELALGRPDVARVVELKLFADLTNEQVAEITGVSRATVIRHWRFARAWLAEKMDVSYAGDAEHRAGG